MRFLLLALAAALPAAAADPLPGHSIHGEAFDDGPRQAAVLMGGCGKVNFPVTTKNELAQKFFTQGIGQIHGFWYYEAERSFRQTADLDPDCAMAYWGCAMANVNNEKRAAEFIKKAGAKKASASAREKAWITLLEDFYKDPKKDKKQRQLDLIKGIEDIIHENPDDLEAKAFLAWAIWEGKGDGVTMVSRESVDAILSQVFAKEPMHPAQHYRIHLWDDSKPARAVEAATLCGQSAPAIAHMWHMPGHTFSKVNRLPDAAWQQEAATRVDHAYMIQTQVLPDQIHNYAHNTEWLVRTYNQLGRAHDAAALARNLIEIPRHPEYNTTDNKSKSAAYGRTRLLDTLLTYELWDELLELDGSPYLDITPNPSMEAARIRALGVAAYFKGDRAGIAARLDQLEKLPAPKKDTPASTDSSKVKPVAKTTEPSSAPAPASAPAKVEETTKPEASDKDSENKPAENKPAGDKETGDKPAKGGKGGKADSAVGNAKAELSALLAILDKQPTAELQKKLTAMKDTPKERMIRYHLAVGDKDKAVAAAQQLPMDAPNLALRVDALMLAGKPDEAKKHFETLRVTAGSLDTNVPISQRIDAIAKEFGAPVPWRRPEAPRTDSGKRPAMESLGPVHWHPFPATPFTLPDESNHPVSLSDFSGKPVVVLFYLSHHCTHCMEQLKAFSTASEDFKKAGLEIVAIGSEEAVDLTATADTCRPGDATKQNAIHLLADPEQLVFRKWRCYDDFEGMPLHGAFLVDGAGQIRWLDVGPDPFTNTKFLLEESKRLLKLQKQ